MTAPTTKAILGSEWLDEPLRTVAATALVLTTLLLMFAGVWLLKRTTRVHPEITRKLMHVGMGLVVCSFPWLFDSLIPVALMGVGSALALLAVRLLSSKTGIGGVVGGVERASLGELYFPISVVLVFWISQGHDHQPLLYTIPLLILALGDAFAALIGLRYGQLPYQVGDGHKSVEGSVAFFSITFLTVHVPLLLFSDIGRAECLLIAVMLGLLAMMLEAIAWRGLDNIFVPIGAIILLQVYLPLGVQDLLLRLGVTILMTAGVFCSRHRSTMDDAALLAVAFFGYTVAMVGGWEWTLAPLALFLCNIILYPRSASASLKPHNGRTHTARSVFANCAVGAICLLAYAKNNWDGWLIPFTVSFSSQLARVLVFGAKSPNSSRPGLPQTTLRGLAAFLSTCGLTFTALWYTGQLTNYPAHSISIIMFTALGATLATAYCFQWLTPFLFQAGPRKLLIDITGIAVAAGAAIWALATVMCLFYGI